MRKGHRDGHNAQMFVIFTYGLLITILDYAVVMSAESGAKILLWRLQCFFLSMQEINATDRRRSGTYPFTVPSFLISVHLRISSILTVI